MRAALLATMLAACAAPAGHVGRSASDVQIVAHRGASRDCPENTLAAFARAVEDGADIVEFDVHQTSDGHWVCLHDRTCDRTTNAVQAFGRDKVRVDGLTLAEVQTLDAGAWFAPAFAGERVPTLEQALRAIAPAVPMIERKGGDPLHLVRELRRLDAVDEVIVQAFDWDWLERVAEAEPRLRLAALGGDAPTPERLADLARTGARIVHWNHARVTRAMVDQVHASGRTLCVYTVDGELPFHGAVAIGCDMVTTNRPGHYVAARAAGWFTRRR